MKGDVPEADWQKRKGCSSRAYLKGEPGTDLKADWEKRPAKKG